MEWSGDKLGMNEMMGFDGFGSRTVSGWSWEENKKFEVALAAVDAGIPHRWEMVAAVFGGKKSAEDVRKHYVILLEDLCFIESGKLDCKLEDPTDNKQLGMQSVNEAELYNSASH